MGREGREGRCSVASVLSLGYGDQDLLPGWLLQYLGLQLVWSTLIPNFNCDFSKQGGPAVLCSRASSPCTCWADDDALCRLERARGTSFSLPNNSLWGMLLLGLAFQFFVKKENNKGEDELRFFYIFTESDHRRETFPSQWVSCGALQSLCTSNQPNRTPPIYLRDPFRDWPGAFFSCNGDKRMCARCMGPLACYPFLAH